MNRLHLKEVIEKNESGLSLAAIFTAFAPLEIPELHLIVRDVIREPGHRHEQTKCDCIYTCCDKPVTMVLASIRNRLWRKVESRCRSCGIKERDRARREREGRKMTGIEGAYYRPTKQADDVDFVNMCWTTKSRGPWMDGDHNSHRYQDVGFVP